MSVFPEFSFPFNDLDDADFNLAIYEMQNGPVRYDADRLASLSFNPLLHNIRTNLGRSFDLDPDTDLRDLFSDDCEYFIVFSHDVTSAILVSQNNITAAMMVSQTSPVGDELFSYANDFFCSKTFA